MADTHDFISWAVSLRKPLSQNPQFNPRVRDFSFQNYISSITNLFRQLVSLIIMAKLIKYFDIIINPLKYL